MILTMNDRCIRLGLIVPHDNNNGLPNWLTPGIDFNGDRHPFIQLGNSRFIVELGNYAARPNHVHARHTPWSVQMNIEGKYYEGNGFHHDNCNDVPRDQHIYVVVPGIGAGIGGIAASKVHSSAFKRRKFIRDDFMLPS